MIKILKVNLVIDFPTGKSHMHHVINYSSDYFMGNHMGNYLLMWNHMGGHVINYLVIILCDR